MSDHSLFFSKVLEVWAWSLHVDVGPIVATQRGVAQAHHFTYRPCDWYVDNCSPNYFRSRLFGHAYICESCISLVERHMTSTSVTFCTVIVLGALFRIGSCFGEHQGRPLCMCHMMRDVQQVWHAPPLCACALY